MTSSSKLTREASGVFVLTMRRGSQNTFTPGFVAELNAHLDTVESSDGPCALVITSEGTFFSTGHDLAFLRGHSHGTTKAEGAAFIDGFYRFLARCMTLSVPTVAAINGHAIAGGCLLALAQAERETEICIMCIQKLNTPLLVPLPGLPDHGNWQRLHLHERD